MQFVKKLFHLQVSKRVQIGMQLEYPIIFELKELTSNLSHFVYSELEGFDLKLLEYSHSDIP